jgi:hypothetical protein
MGVFFNSHCDNVIVQTFSMGIFYAIVEVCGDFFHYPVIPPACPALYMLLKLLPIMLHHQYVFDMSIILI